MKCSILFCLQASSREKIICASISRECYKDLFLEWSVVQFEFYSIWNKSPKGSWRQHRLLWEMLAKVFFFFFALPFQNQTHIHYEKCQLYHLNWCNSWTKIMVLNVCSVLSENRSVWTWQCLCWLSMSRQLRNKMSVELR